MNNHRSHYISQFILKRFSKALNIFNVKNGLIEQDKRPDRAFCEINKYDKELEQIFNFNIESRVANILDKNILIDSDITLTREELILLKKYMLISSVRTMTEDEFYKTMIDFEKNAERYISIWKEYNHLPSIRNVQLTPKQLYSNALKLFAVNQTIRDIALSPLATREMLAWAVPFIESYIAFWDAPKGHEFILSDTGMCSEYEGFHMISGGVDISKVSYLLNRAKKKNPAYYSLIASQFTMYENYNIFTISSTRSMIMINPFFRLYYDFMVYEIGSHQTVTLDKPDIWPAIIQNKLLFEPPKTKYKINQFIENHTMNDEFVYKPKTLTKEDLIYLNSLILAQSKNIIGFNNAKHIIDSIYYFVWYDTKFRSIKSHTDTIKQQTNQLIENLKNSTFFELCNFCNKEGGINKTEFIFLFEKLLSNIYKDFDNNPYICEYYLAMPEETTNFTVLDFLGKGEKKLEFFRKHLEEIKKNKESQ